ncbi:hypothetical protein N0M98_30900 [Paenibacillus doosanensis]|uniref:Endonuclease NucS n=1 Tax=Paenibacillus konkukensis TaxID=2020716 RepID=A0ABY4RTY0_9BACL|nr:MULTISPECIES: hypothetical protein [Paenibacillus]MCS7464511.1 hypothetical protein [Paenibacillus doosanensis]UQZ85442.1 Endonuclease NucS [Paenibacillus konkukensis]
MYNIKNKKATKVDAVTFAELKMAESDMEELLRNSIEMLCDDEESMLIVGRQVKNESLGRSDLTAVDNNGNIVLIEIKRDRKDIENRKEAFEFQAIRYAASYATIADTDDLVKKVYAPYIEKHKGEFELGELTSYELGLRKLNEFLKVNGAEASFNKKQKIILVASGYDDQTLSAVAWLNSNGVDMSCYKLTPYTINHELLITAEKLLPLANYDDYYVNLIERTPSRIKLTKDIKRRSLPKIDEMLQWGVVKEGDIIVAKGRDDEATLLNNGNVRVDGKEKSLLAWLKEVFGWSNIATYDFSVLKESGKTLYQIREEYMNKQTSESGEDT